MSDPKLAHPSADELARFVSGLLDQAQSTTIETHLSDCGTCRTVLEGLPDDSLVAALRAPAAVAPDEATLVPAAGPPLPAELLDHPRYRPLGLLGTGGMGAVYKAEHRLMERLVALKVINPELIDKPAAVERFGREVKAAARLSHPNIVTAYDAERVGNMHFLVMEFVEGTCLADLVREQGRLPIALACDCVRQAALGLQHAHERGMVHRDIKPQNILLTADRQAKVLDFGLARFVSESRPAGAGLTELGTVMGTPDYMAPEQARDPRQADVRADLYSLGCTLYHLLVGHPPFPGGTTVDKLVAHLERLPRPLTDLRGDVPPALARIVERLMAKDPAQRYQTPTEVAEALTPFCPGVPSAPATRVPARRPRRLAAAVAVLLAAASLLLAAAVIRIATDTGTLVIETVDPDVEVEVKQGGKVVRLIDLKTKQEIDLRAGTYELELVGGKEGLKLSTNQFTLARAGRAVVTVRLEPKVPPGSPAPSLPPGDEVRRFDGHERTVNCMALSPDGRLALSAGEFDLTLRLWDVTTGKELYRFQGYEEVTGGVAFSRDGRLALSGGGGRWQGGRWVAGVDHALRLWDVGTRREVRRFRGHEGPVNAVALSADGARALSGGVERTLRLWDVATGKELRQFEGHRNDVLAIAFSPDGRLALSAGWDQTVRLWEVATGKEVRRFKGHTALVYGVAFSPDGTQALSGGADQHLRLWDVQSGRALLSLRHPTGIGGVAFTPDGRRALSGSGACLADDGSDYLSADFDCRVRLWDLATGKELQRFEGHTGAVWNVDCSADGRYALSGSSDGTLRLWKLPKPAEPAKPAAAGAESKG
jgi:WD40 repeat protein/tRNA A-37 threonylcarbamoyl transferase component Bud32